MTSKIYAKKVLKITTLNCNYLPKKTSSSVNKFKNTLLCIFRSHMYFETVLKIFAKEIYALLKILWFLYF